MAVEVGTQWSLCCRSRQALGVGAGACHEELPVQGLLPFIHARSSEFCLATSMPFPQVAEETQTKIDAARRGYRPCGEYGAVLFFCIADLAGVEPMYQYR